MPSTKPGHITPSDRAEGIASDNKGKKSAINNKKGKRKSTGAVVQIDEVLKDDLFKAIRSNNLDEIKNILSAHKHFVNEKMYGYEGADIVGVLQHPSATNSCYNYSGKEKVEGCTMLMPSSNQEI